MRCKNHCGWYAWDVSKFSETISVFLTSVLRHRVNGSPQGEWNFCKGEWKKRGEWRVIEFSVAKLLRPLVLVFLPNTFQQSCIKWPTSSVLTLRLKQPATYHLRRTVLHDAVNYLHAMIAVDSVPCFTYSSDGISAVPAWTSCTPERRLPGRIAVLTKVSFSISGDNQTREHWSEWPYHLK